MTDQEKKRKRRPRDANQLAKAIVDSATDEVVDDSPTQTDDGKDPAAVNLGRRGGLKGGKARAQKLTAKKRSDIARRAAHARWREST